MERVGVVADDLTGVVQFLSGFKYSPNPKAKDFNLMSVLKYIESATRPCEMRIHTIVYVSRIGILL